MKLQEILKSLNHKEKVQLYKLLERDISETPQFSEVKFSQNKEQKLLCPHCKNDDIYSHGLYKGRKRYKCKKCDKTFNDYTGTAISGIKKIELFQEYLELTVENISIRKASKRLGVNVKTIFDWRHKLLSSFTSINGSSFIGIVECDDKQLDRNEKGKRNLDRKPYKRSSDRNKKRGISNEKVSIMVATDRKGNPTMRVAKMGRIDVVSIEKTIGDLVNNENVLCSDAHPSIISWAKNKEFEHHTFVASREHVKNKCYHVQHVNSLDNLFERWIKPFYGVATKYLPQYLNWFVFLEKTKNMTNPTMEFAKVVVSNTSATKTFRNIENNYLELNVPQLS